MKLAENIGDSQVKLTVPAEPSEGSAAANDLLRVIAAAEPLIDISNSNSAKGLAERNTITQAPPPNSVGIKSRSIIQPSIQTSESKEAPNTKDNGVDKPRCGPGIALSAVMALSCIIGFSEPLHLVLGPAGINTPYIHGAVSFLDVYFVLMPVAVLYWSFCLFKISGAFSNSSTKRLTSALISTLFSPAAYATFMLMAQVALIMVHDAQGQRFGSLVTLFSLAAPAAMIFWLHRFMSRVANLQTANPYSWLKKLLPSAIILCHLLPIAVFGIIFSSHIAMPLLGVQEFQQAVTQGTYLPYVTSLFTLVFLGCLGVAVGQGVAFVMLQKFLDELPKLNRPKDSEQDCQS